MEYCIMHPSYPDEPHRGPWSLDMCQEWLSEDDDWAWRGGFYIAARTVSPWQRLEHAQ